MGRSVGRLLCLRDGDAAVPDVDRFVSTSASFRTNSSPENNNRDPRNQFHPKTRVPRVSISGIQSLDNLCDNVHPNE